MRSQAALKGPRLIRERHADPRVLQGSKAEKGCPGQVAKRAIPLPEGQRVPRRIRLHLRNPVRQHQAATRQNRLGNPIKVMVNQARRTHINRDFVRAAASLQVERPADYAFVRCSPYGSFPPCLGRSLVCFLLLLRVQAVAKDTAGNPSSAMVQVTH
jgi:hypothetical protein